MGAIGVLINIAIVENSGIAISYDILVRKHLRTLCRKRKSDTVYYALLASEIPELEKQLYTARNAQRPEEESGRRSDPSPKKKRNGI